MCEGCHTFRTKWNRFACGRSFERTELRKQFGRVGARKRTRGGEGGRDNARVVLRAQRSFHVRSRHVPRSRVGVRSPPTLNPVQAPRSPEPTRPNQLITFAIPISSFALSNYYCLLVCLHKLVSPDPSADLFFSDSLLTIIKPDLDFELCSKFL